MGKKRRFGIRAKIVTGNLIVVLCLIASIILVNNHVSSLQKERNYIINHDITVHDFTNRIEKRLLDMETSQRGYIISGNEDYLKPYQEAESKWEDEYSQLYALLSDNPKQQTKLKTIKTKINHWIRTAGDPTIKLKKENKTKELNQFFSSGNGHKDMDEIRTQFDTFRNTEKSLTNNRAEKLDKQNAILSLGLFGLIILLTVIALGAAIMVSKSIINTVNEVVHTIKQMATTKGNIEKRINVKTNDEIKDLSDATNSLVDVLSQRNWLQRKIADIVKMYQGVSSLNVLNEKFVAGMTKVTDASFGALYLREEKGEDVRFIKKAVYADPHEEIGRESFALGQGIIGQCAAEKEVKVINQIPGNYRFITSALGDIEPRSILIAPITFEGKTIAVLELASLHEFTSIQQNLVDEVLSTFGLTMHSVMGRMEIERLLKESQAMTEELQAQSEELQTQSEELNMQSEELRMINEQLEERTEEAEERTRELEVAKEELEAKARQLTLSSKYKSEFMANMSHELRTPLNSILILSEMLAENSDNNLSEENAEFARVIHTSGKDLLALINDVLDLSKVEAGKLDMVFAEMNMSELPSHLERNFSHIAKQKELDFHILIDENVPNIFYTDEKRFQQIIKNLLSNAFKFTTTGSISVAIRPVEEAVVSRWLRIEGAEYWVEITVKDTGIGIPKDKQALVFEAFQQADGATVRKYGGTGLGLSISREFAQLLGGKISLQSEEGVGSVFKLYLPSLPNGLQMIDTIEESAEIAATSLQESVMILEEEETFMLENELPSRDQKSVFSGKNVLIVDDDNRNIFALKTALKKEGMNIITANDGVECLEIMKEKSDFDIILMDIMMPGMDGYDTMRRIREDEAYESLPIIALTAKAMRDDREKCLEAGASDYISKPLELEQLFSVMRVWLTR
ncbi:CHASE3 domain-containing protein [Heyndrickxia vini]|uniref:histidine kinase n=1 Tax=Heyndrickxia vini TaxID=1476025 RepID=A0ABX7E4H5_9BACI|nr:CHASE3 domain-containing protein [Heyndrickxia vini]QQZ10174.1 CHASE3 domain-containing protein [Heyndrickxia vini]